MLRASDFEFELVVIQLRTSSQDHNVLQASATFLNFSGIRFRWELLRSALSVLTLDWGLARGEGTIQGKLRMVSDEYLLVKGATPNRRKFPR